MLASFRDGATITWQMGQFRPRFHTLALKTLLPFAQLIFCFVIFLFSFLLLSVLLTSFYTVLLSVDLLASCANGLAFRAKLFTFHNRVVRPECELFNPNTPDTLIRIILVILRCIPFSSQSVAILWAKYLQKMAPCVMFIHFIFLSGFWFSYVEFFLCAWTCIFNNLSLIVFALWLSLTSPNNHWFCRIV